MRNIRNHAILAAFLLLGSSVAMADEPTNNQPAQDQTTGTPEATAPPTPTNQLPPPESTHEPAPPVPTPSVPGLNPPVEQAGIGSNVGYGRAGVLELGGFFGLNVAQKVRDLDFSPTIGWFLVNNLEASLILSITNIKDNMNEATMWSALVEPSFHIPFNRSVFGFLGMGVGAAYITNLGAGVSVAPRIGMNIMVGRSGILTPSLSYQYTTHNADAMLNANGTEDVTLVAISSALRVNVGYTVMW